MAKAKLSDLHFNFTPRGPAQLEAKELWRRSRVMFMIGSPGCGKTHTALGLALNEMSRSSTSKLVLTRPMVFCEEQTGFLPGDLNAKLGAWLGPFYDVWSSMSEDTEWSKFQASLDKRLEIIPVGMMRGRTIRGFCLVDEAQGLSYSQLKMIVTRLGEGGKIIFSGDPSQSDRFSYENSPLLEMAENLSDLDTVSTIYFKRVDQQRDPLINDILDRI